jgi:phage terminase large subunit-like protein
LAKRRLASAEVIEFVEEFCLIPEGHAVGQPMVLMDWQRDFIREMFDNEHGTRRAIRSVGRKNAKTCLSARSCSPT